MTEYSKDKEIKDNEWKYEQPVKIICGRGAIEEVSTTCKGVTTSEYSGESRKSNRANVI